jgi:ABC-type sugar transport system ATPase subunit
VAKRGEMLEIHDLTKRYGVVALDGATFTVTPGQILESRSPASLPSTVR